MYGILDIAQNLAIHSKHASTLAHCYYLAKLSLDIVTTKFIQFKAIEVLHTIYKREPKAFSVVQIDLSKEAFYNIKDYIDKKHTYISQTTERVIFEISILTA